MSDTNQLVGKYFHTFRTYPDCDCRTVQYQGHIVAHIQGEYYLVQYFEWIVGEPSTYQIVTIEEMLDWNIYEDAEQMSFQWGYGGLSRQTDHHLDHTIKVPSDAGSSSRVGRLVAAKDIPVTGGPNKRRSAS